MSATMTSKPVPIRMNLSDAARHIGVSPRKLQRLVAKKLIRFVTDPGGVRMYPTVELQKYLDSQIAEQWKNENE